MMDNNMVHFNVGGIRYDVSRSLLDMHPNTMLARSAHELWHTDPESVIFLERNGERFQYVLDYLRDGHAYLPVGIPKEALMKDLEYYCLDSIDSNRIERKLTCAALVLQELRNEMCSWDVTMNATKMEMKALEEQMKNVKLHQACIVLVKECTARYLKDGDLLLFLSTDAEQDKVAIVAAQTILKYSGHNNNNNNNNNNSTPPQDAFDQCNSYLHKVGLMFASIEETYGAGYDEDFTIRMVLMDDHDEDNHDLIEC
jgi:hypothetical protein